MKNYAAAAVVAFAFAGIIIYKAIAILHTVTIPH